MASQVLSGSGNVSYTNNTGQNVRIIVNYMSSSTNNITMSWAGVSVSSSLSAIGRNLAFTATSNPGVTSGTQQYAQNAISPFNNNTVTSLPTEIMIASGETFSASNINGYNIVVIPEAG